MFYQYNTRVYTCVVTIANTPKLGYELLPIQHMIQI